MNQRHRKIGILGDGGWGTTLSLLLAEKGYSVTLWGNFSGYAEEIERLRENKKFLPGFKLPKNIKATGNIQSACEVDVIVLAAPSQFMRSVVGKIKGLDLKNKTFVSVAKGIETGSLKVMSQVIQEELGRVRLCVLSGPSIAREVAQRMPAAASVASKDKALTSEVRQIFTTDYFSLYESSDVLGVELGGSVKNVIAISAGIVEGLGYGSNTRAALLARGVAEMARLGQRMGAKRETFMGLSGLGDLATTCICPTSRNRSLGEEIGKGKKLEAILKKTEMIVEGVETAKSAFALSQKYKIDMPITEAVHGILFKNKNPREAVTALMQKTPFRELD